MSNNGVDFSNDGVLFFLEDSSHVLSLSPTAVTEEGGQSITIMGINFYQTYPSVLACRFGDLDPPVPATYLSAESITCVAPPHLPGLVKVEVTVNGQDWSDNGVMMEYRPAIMLQDIHPLMGPRRGGTELMIRGSNYRETDLISCHFGTTSGPLLQSSAR